MDDRPPPVLEYGRPPPSPWRGNVLRTCVVFGMAIVLFGCCILGGYLGHLLAPRPDYSVDFKIDLPVGTTPQSSPALAVSLAEIRRPETVAYALRVKGLGGQEDPVQLSKRMRLTAPAKKLDDPTIKVEFVDKTAKHAWDVAWALTAKLDAILTMNGQRHSLNALQRRWKFASRREDPFEVWFIGCGVVVAVALPGMVIWRFRKTLFPQIAQSPHSWQDHGQPI
jgi:hypothetical protein